MAKRQRLILSIIRYFLIISSFILLCSSLISHAESTEITEYKLINTASGVIRGKADVTIFNGRKYFAFKGIPYANAPVGDLRFKIPEPVATWSDVRDAFKYGSDCIQTMDGKHVVGDEDCLFLNVYVPDKEPTTKLPVMFYIHGGGYKFDSSNDKLFGPDFLIDENVILVTTNYRLGVLGFLSLGSPNCTGNMGLKDQQLALKWVNENIESFGGDRNAITLFGNSAGGSSAHFHVLVPESQKLFNRAIIMSGTALNIWAQTSLSIDDFEWNMFALSKRNDLNVRNSGELLEALKALPAEKLIKETHNAFYKSGGTGRSIHFPYAPVIEDKNDPNPFMTQTPEKLYQQLDYDKDTMFGYTSAEMLFITAKEINNPELLTQFNEKFYIDFPFRGVKLEQTSEAYQNLSNEVRTFYFGENGTVSNETIIEFNDMLSDMWMVVDIDRSAKLHAEKSRGKTFYYRFSIDSKFNEYKISNNVSLPGSSHADELCYLFRCHKNPKLYVDVNKDSVEYAAVKRMTALWANFARFGNPTPNADPVDFQPIIGDTIHFTDIRNEGLFPAKSPHKAHLEFWHDLRRKYYEATANLDDESKRDEF